MAMSRDEIDDYTNSMHEGLKGSSGHLEIKYMIIFAGLGVICAAGLMYFVFSMLSNIAFDDLTDEEELLKSGGEQSDRQGLIDSSDGKCAVCRMDTKGQGSTWQTTGVGGCGYLTCNDCFVNYCPLKERCEICGQFYCYRRGRVTFIDLMKEEQEKEMQRKHLPSREEDAQDAEFEEYVAKINNEDSRYKATIKNEDDDGLRRRVVSGGGHSHGGVACNGDHSS